MIREILVAETGELRKETATKDVEIAAAKEAVQTASTKADKLVSELEKVISTSPFFPPHCRCVVVEDRCHRPLFAVHPACSSFYFSFPCSTMMLMLTALLFSFSDMRGVRMCRHGATAGKQRTAEKKAALS